MNAKIHPAVAFVAIVCVLAVIGFLFWKANEDKPLREGNGASIAMDRAPKRPNSGAGEQPTSKAGKPGAEAGEQPTPKAGKPSSSGDAHTGQ